VTIAQQLSRVDWKTAMESLEQRGHAVIPSVLASSECRALAALYSDDRRFRSTVVMERHAFGIGEYRYFRYPLPRVVQQLRTRLYRELAPVANDWMRRLRRALRYPGSLEEFLEICRDHGQSRPTPLLLRYAEAGYNCLHRDLYGEISFPLQATLFLSRPGEDFSGGEFLLLERRARAQSRGEAIVCEQGALLVFPNSDRPARGKRGDVRVETRHGVSRIHRGERYALGIIFHDAK
jgi:hypothetical protein